MTGLAFLARDIASRLHHRGALICPEQVNDFLSDLREMATFDLTSLKQSFDARKIEILAAYGFNDPPPQTKPFAFADGMAVIPIQGMLVNRLSWGSSYATGYNFIQSQMQAALADPDVRGIVFDVNSYGGIAAGCGELAKEIFDARSVKPSMAVVDSKAYSAAYYLGSAAGKMIVTPSGGVGSIGCVAMHVDYSEMLDSDGLKVTMIHAGKEKVDGNPFEQLSARAKATIQRDVDYHYGLFTEAVAQHRDMPVEDVRATEAGVFLPPEALDAGLIDAIETPAEAISNFGSQVATNGTAMSSKTEGIEMDEKQIREIVSSAIGPSVKEAVAAEIGPAVTTAVTAAMAAVNAANDRKSAIRTCEEAKGREALANHFADSTEMSVDAAKAALAAAPKSAPEGSGTTSRQPASGFAGAMDNTRNPDVKPDSGSGGPAGEGADTSEARAGRILAAYGKASGIVIDMKPKAA